MPNWWRTVFAAMTLVLPVANTQHDRRAVDLKPITGRWSVFIGPLCWGMVPSEELNPPRYALASQDKQTRRCRGERADELGPGMPTALPVQSFIFYGNWPQPEAIAIY